MSVDTLAPEVQLAFGLGRLIESATHIQRILYSEDGRKAYEYPTELQNHPFNLPIPDRGRPRRWDGIAFLGYPLYTEPSVRAFAAYVLERLTYGPPIPVIRYMREIFAEVDPEDRTPHDVFFEIMVDDEIFMCGGCSDSSGAGNKGRRELDALFEVFSRLTGVGIARVTIPYAQAAPAAAAITRACGQAV